MRFHGQLQPLLIDAWGLLDASAQRKRTEVAAAAAAKASTKLKTTNPEEAAFLDRREAARQRVQQRTMTTFGLS